MMRRQRCGMQAPAAQPALTATLHSMKSDSYNAYSLVLSIKEEMCVAKGRPDLADASERSAGRPMECTGSPSSACRSAGANWSCPQPSLPATSTLGWYMPLPAETALFLMLRITNVHACVGDIGLSLPSLFSVQIALTHASAEARILSWALDMLSLGIHASRPLPCQRSR